MLGVVAPLSLVASPAHAACRLQRVAIAALTTTAQGWTVPVSLNGTVVPFLVDTGAERSMVFEDTAERVGLARDSWVATTLRGVGGVVRRPNALPRMLSLDGVALRRRALGGSDTSLAVGPAVGGGLAGLLGTDMLAAFDVEIDPARASFSLFATQDCRGRYAPWTGDYVALATVRATPTITLVPVQVDGVPLDALLDTGSALTLLSLTGAARLGSGVAPPPLQADDSGADVPARVVSGIGAASVTVRPRAARLGVGDGVARAMTMWAGDVRTLRSVGVVLGRDWIAGRALWLSPANSAVFVAAEAR